MISSVDDALIFLIETLFNLYVLILMLRVVLQWVGANFYNPISQFVLKLTNPVVTPLRKILPPFKGIDIASLLILTSLEFIKFFIVIWLGLKIIPGFIGLVIMSFGDI